jgi:prevent-host-death family protein
MNASEFKAKCLKVLDQVARTGEPLTILKRGEPVAQLVPATPRDEGYPQETLFGAGRILGDVVSPAVSSDDWDANGGLVE